jgi:Tfp pilus assembly protein PilN
VKERTPSERLFWLPLAAVVVLTIAGAAAGGYVVGANTRKSDDEVSQLVQEAQEQAGERAAEQVRRIRNAWAKRVKRERRKAETVERQKAAAQQPSSVPGLTYTESLPHGKPGYVLPEEARSLGCVGLDAETGECVGD